MLTRLSAAFIALMISFALFPLLPFTATWMIIELIMLVRKYKKARAELRLQQQQHAYDQHTKVLRQRANLL